MATRVMTMWVIFVGSPYHRGVGTRYLARNGRVTNRKDEAQKFSTASAARDFVTENEITLDGRERHIGQESFTQAEIEWRPLG